MFGRKRVAEEPRPAVSDLRVEASAPEVSKDSRSTPPEVGHLASADFLYTERIRWPEENEPFEGARQLYEAIRSTVGHPLGGVIKTDEQFLVSPGQLMVSSAFPCDGELWMVGGLAPTSLGFLDVIDVAVRDGRNIEWARFDARLAPFVVPNQHVHLSRTIGESFTTPFTAMNPTGIGISTDRRVFSSIEHLSGADGILRVRELASGAANAMVPVAISGSEVPRFSSDGQWLVVDGWAGTNQDRTVLIHVDSGRSVALQLGDVASLDWLDAAGPSVLLGTRRNEDSGSYEVFTFDLESAALSVLTSVAPHPGTVFNWVGSIRCNANGTAALATSYQGRDIARLHEYGGTPNVIVIDMRSLQTDVIGSGDLDGHPGVMIERRAPAWNEERRSAGSTMVHHSLESSLAPSTADSSFDGVWTDRIGDLSRKTIHACFLAQTGEAGIRGDSSVVSIFKRALIDLAKGAPSEYGEIREQITEFVFPRFGHALGSSEPNDVAARSISQIEYMVREGQLDAAEAEPMFSSWFRQEPW